jgi:hypothetical protein
MFSIRLPTQKELEAEFTTTLLSRSFEFAVKSLKVQAKIFELNIFIAKITNEFWKTVPFMNSLHVSLQSIVVGKDISAGFAFFLCLVPGPLLSMWYNFFVTDTAAKSTRVFVRSKWIRDSQLFTSKAGAYPSGVIYHTPL